MGLDMYLVKYKRVGNILPNQMDAVCSFVEWIHHLAKGGDCSFKEWNGWANNNLMTLSVEDIKKVIPNVKKKQEILYNGNTYDYCEIGEKVGQWRKANAIHNWFVENIQDGKDDCNYHREVTKKDLEELMNTCQRVLDSLKMVDGKIHAYDTYDSAGNRVEHFSDGKVASNTELAEELLPTTDGFLFGSINYDEYYVNSLEYTIEICKNAIETTDFDKEMIYYCSSF